MASPSPVPPNLRVVEASACWNAWKSRELRGSDPHAGVDHRALELGLGGVAGEEANGDLDRAGFGELDRIAHQVDQDLPEARRIGLDGLRNGPGVLQRQGQSLGLGPHPHERHDFRQDGRGRDAQPLDLDFAGLDLRQVEDVAPRIAAAGRHGPGRPDQLFQGRRLRRISHAIAATTTRE